MSLKVEGRAGQGLGLKRSALRGAARRVPCDARSTGPRRNSLRACGAPDVEAIEVDPQPTDDQIAAVVADASVTETASTNEDLDAKNGIAAEGDPSLAWLRDAPPFATFGAGSPGVVNADSQIHTLVEALPERGVGSVVPQLHVTLNEAELTGPIPIYRGL